MSVQANLVDKVHAPEARGDGPLRWYPVSLSGEKAESKLKRVRKIISTRARSDDWVYILPTLPTIAWLLNYRCKTDIPFLPVAFAYCVLTATSCQIFVDKAKLVDDELANAWKEAGVEVQEYGVKAVGKYVAKAVGNGKDVKVIGAKECSWEVVQLCEPVRQWYLLSDPRRLSSSSRVLSRRRWCRRTMWSCKTTATRTSAMGVLWWVVVCQANNRSAGWRGWSRSSSRRRRRLANGLPRWC